MTFNFSLWSYLITGASKTLTWLFISCVAEGRNMSLLRHAENTLFDGGDIKTWHFFPWFSNFRTIQLTVTLRLMTGFWLSRFKVTVIFFSIIWETDLEQSDDHCPTLLLESVVEIWPINVLREQFVNFAFVAHRHHVADCIKICENGNRRDAQSKLNLFAYFDINIVVTQTY